MADRNIALGLTIAFFGLILGLGAYILLENVALTAMGIGLVIVGVAWALTPVHPIPRKAILEIVESSCSNIEGLLEFIGATGRAVYLPSTADGRVVAYVSLAGSGNLSLRAVADNAGRVIVRQGGSLGVIITPPRVELISGNLGFDAGGENIKSLLEYVLVEGSGVAESVRAVRSGNEFVIDVYKVRVDVNHPRFKAVMGSLPSCLAAQAVAAAFSSPVQVVDERRDGDRLIVHLRLLDWTETIST